MCPKGKLKTAYVRRLEALPGWLWESVRDERSGNRTPSPRGVCEETPSRQDSGEVCRQWIWTRNLGRFPTHELHVGDVGHRSRPPPGKCAGLGLGQPTPDLWEEGFQHLLNYVAEHGDARVPKTCIVDGYRLGQWVGVQRSGNNKGTLPLERRRRLRRASGLELGWENRLRGRKVSAKLLEFVDAHKHRRVPQLYSAGRFRLGTWVTLQRKAYFGGTLTPDQVERLAALQQRSWNAREDAWDKAFEPVAKYTRRHGQAPR